MLLRKGHAQHSIKPSLRELLDTLNFAFASVSSTYVVVDALD
jgi:hypothetical protein